MKLIDKRLLEEKSKKYAVELDTQALERFDTYARLLVEWNEKMNLTAITQPDEIVMKHFVDCLTFLKYVPVPQGAKLADVGTGAGFPALPLLIARPDLEITLIDSLNKRLVFLEAVLRELGLRAEILHCRGEDGGKQRALREQFDLSCARAVAGMNVLAELCLPYVKTGGLFVAMKGADAGDIQNGEAAVRLLGGKIARIEQFELENYGRRNIAVVEKGSPTPQKYPRSSARIAKTPL